MEVNGNAFLKRYQTPSIRDQIWLETVNDYTGFTQAADYPRPAYSKFFMLLCETGVDHYHRG